ncbi:signal peptidase complex subunit 1 [Culex pipiens pallens]|nr:signal peptidase complex subunit 1 [Culex pipiens pallens]
MFNIATHMDFEGQGRAERLSRLIITLFGAVGLVWGYVIQQFSQTVYILIAGVLLASILTIPPWPIYRRKALSWQKARPEAQVTTPGSEPESSKKKKK